MNKGILTLSLVILCVSCGKKGSHSEPVLETLPQTSESFTVNYSASFDSTDNLKTLTNRMQMLDKSHSKYINVDIKRDKEQKELNYTTFDKGLRNVNIVGLHVVLGGTHSDKLYDLIKKTTDVQSLEMDIEKLEINESVHIAGANVIIRAKEVIFGERGQINTTPISKKEKAQQFSNGVDGLSGGNITIIADKISHQGNLHLITNGGDGQDAGPGQNGARGHNAHIVKGANIYEDVTLHTFENCMSGGICNTITSYETKTGRPSGNGRPAQAGGLPGNPGNAGIITLNKKVDIKFSSLGGNAGSPDEKRTGGAPGNPATTCKRDHKGKVHSCITAIKGDDAEAPKTLNSIGLSQNLNIKSEIMASSALAKMQFKYAKDLYRFNHVDQAQKVFLEIVQHLDLLPEKDLTSFEVKTGLRAMLNQISLHKDYFGKTQAWTPNLSFEVNYKTFEQEIKRNLKLLYFTEWLQSNLLTLEDKSFAIKEIQSSLFQDIDNSRTSITKLVNRTAEISEIVEELKVAQNEFDYELKLVEKEILAMAQNNLKVPFHKKALAIFSAASKAIPVGQPTFGLIGTGIDFIDRFNQKDANYWEIIKSIPSTAKAFKDFDWKKSNQELNAALDELDPRTLANFKTNKERLQYFERLGDFSGPLFTAVSNQLSEFKKQEVSKSKLDAEIDKIKESHPLYNRLVVALSKLHVKKEQYQKALSEFNNQIEAALVAIQENFLSIAYLYDDLEQLNSIASGEFINQAKDIKEHAIDRLNYYHYLFAKSYEYRFLRTYTRSLSYDSLFSEMSKLIALNAYAIENVVDALQGFYMNDLSSIIADIVTESINSSKNFDLHQEYHFNKSEIDALNRGEKIFVDLTQFFDEDKEDIRLQSVTLMEGFTISGAKSDVELVIQHSGTSIIGLKGQKYIFEHSSVNSSNLTWISYKGIYSGHISYSETSESDKNLFREIFNLSDQTNIFVRPGGLTFISVHLKKKKEAVLDNLHLDVRYQASFK